MALVVLGMGQPSVTLAAPAADSAGVLKSALAKTAATTVYRLDMDMKMKGALLNGVGGAAAGANQEISLLAMTGEINGKDAHITMKGYFSTMVGVDQNKGLELMTVGGKTYIHGPVPMMGAKEDKWYVMTTSQSTGSLGQPQNLGALATADMSVFQAAGSEALDGHKCDIYGTADKNAIAKAFGTFGSGGLLSQSDLKDVTSAELKFWVCDDGYLHRMHVAIEGADKSNPATKGSMQLAFHVYDFNGAISIVAPANAASLEQPSGAFQTLPSQPSAQDLSARVVNGGNIRQTPDKKGVVLGQLHAGQVVTLEQRTINGLWYYVTAPEASGWVHASLLRISPAAASHVFVNGEATLAKPVSEQLSATVINGGNRRSAPYVKSDVLGQVHVGQIIQLLARTKNGTWYYARCECGARGWVHASLLKIDPKVARKVPVV
jgi:hypothetical protein